MPLTIKEYMPEITELQLTGTAAADPEGLAADIIYALRSRP